MQLASIQGPTSNNGGGSTTSSARTIPEYDYTKVKVIAQSHITQYLYGISPSVTSTAPSASSSFKITSNITGSTSLGTCSASFASASCTLGNSDSSDKRYSYCNINSTANYVSSGGNVTFTFSAYNLSQGTSHTNILYHGSYWDFYDRYKILAYSDSLSVYIY